MLGIVSILLTIWPLLNIHGVNSLALDVEAEVQVGPILHHLYLLLGDHLYLPLWVLYVLLLLGRPHHVLCLERGVWPFLLYELLLLTLS